MRTPCGRHALLRAIGVGGSLCAEEGETKTRGVHMMSFESPGTPSSSHEACSQ